MALSNPILFLNYGNIGRLASAMYWYTDFIQQVFLETSAEF